MSSLLVFNRVYRQEIQSVMLVFSTLLVNRCPSTFSLTSPTPSPPFQSKRTVYTDSVWLWGGGVCIVGTIFCRSLTLWFSDQTQNLQKCYTPQKKPQQRRHLEMGVFIVPLSMVSGCTSGRRRRRPCSRIVPAFASLPPATPRRAAADQWWTALRIHCWRRVSKSSIS